jgi:DNA repair exonuclease SbcCD ATPase subunit
VEGWMDTITFDALEDKITKLIGLLNRLKQENKELKEKNQELKTLVNEKENSIQTFKEKSQQFNGMQTELQSFRENQNRIRQKVESLLLKLKEFEDLE